MVAASSLPGLRLLHLDATTGLAAGRNRGVDEAAAPVVTFLDGDDWVAPGYLDDALEVFARRDVDVMRVDHTRVIGNRREVVRNPIGLRGVPLLARDHVLPVHRPTIVDFPTAWSGFYRTVFLREHALRFDESLLTAEDRDWWWRVVLADGRMSFEDLNGHRYRRDVAGSLTQIGDARQLHYFDSLDRTLAAVGGDRDADRFLPKAWRGYLAILLSHHLRADRLLPEVRREQRHRAREALGRFPPELASRTLVVMARYDVETLVELGLPQPDLDALPLSSRPAPTEIVAGADDRVERRGVSAR